MNSPESIQSIPDICEVETIRGAGADPASPPDLVFEVPHGATRAADYETLRSRLTSRLPDDLEQFFFVNTDVGAWECALRAARQVVEPIESSYLSRVLGPECLERVGQLPPRQVLLVRSLVPRTFIDCNRVVEVAAGELHSGGLTQGLPDYITTEQDIATLAALHASYTEVATRAIDLVCGGGGQGLMLHTYAPKSVGIVNIDGGIVKALQRAYEPAVYETWDDRPEVDVISETTEGARHAPPGLVEAVRDYYSTIGVDATENVSYRLHEGTMGYVHSARHPGRMICIEINRALLADPFAPFEEMTIGERKAQQMAAPIAAAFLAERVRQR